jgi:hypothetical protein
MTRWTNCHTPTSFRLWDVVDIATEKRGVSRDLVIEVPGIDERLVAEIHLTGAYAAKIDQLPRHAEVLSK